MSAGERMSQDDRGFLRSLVELSSHEEPEPLLHRALEILVELSGAREAYLELSGDGEPDTVRWWSAAGCDATRIDQIRTAISKGIIAEAIASGEMVVTVCAMDDLRFKDLESVREHEIESVLCAPIGRERPVGALYLQGQRGAAGLEPFSDEVEDRVRLFARALGPIAELLVRRLDDELGAQVDHGGAFTAVIARSAVMQELIARLRLVASLDVHLLLTGPSGAGKTLLAHATHAESKRRTCPFIEINCAALPESLIENELFGADPGAHSAVPRGGMRGKVEAAEGGTLFLDEVGELSLASQAKLLQLLQDRVYYRLGGSVPRKADVRIIAATNISLPTAVAEKRFREDLYYRLKVLEAQVPPLDERSEDVVPLAAHFCRTAAARHGLPAHRLSPGAVRTIRMLTWPGNVRELANRVESGVLNAHLRGAQCVEARDLVAGATTAGDVAEAPLTLQEATRVFQRRHVLGVLEATEWNVSEAARQLDVARSYLYTLIRTHGLRRTE